MTDNPGTEASFARLDKMTREQVLIFAVGILVVVVDGFDALMMGYIAPAISESWHLQKGALAPVFAAGLSGLTIGALIFGPIAALFGVKRTIVGSLFGFGIITLASLFATGVPSLSLIRFIDGLVLGGVLPNTLTLVSNSMPIRYRTIFVTLLSTSFSIGSVLAGLLTAQLVSEHGWQSLFWIGGISPLIIAPMALVCFPAEARTGDREVDAHIAPPVGATGRSPLELFGGNLLPITLLLWVMLFFHTGALYFITNWLPTLMHDSGFALADSAMATTMFHLGGFGGAIILGILAGRFGGGILVVSCLASAGLIATIGLGHSLAAIYVLSFCAGAAVIGTIHVTYGFAASSIYEPEIKAIGMGWAIGVSRLGAVVAGSLAAGWLVQLSLPDATTFAVGAIQDLIAAGAVAILLLVLRQRPRAYSLEAARTGCSGKLAAR